MMAGSGEYLHVNKHIAAKTLFCKTSNFNFNDCPGLWRTLLYCIIGSVYYEYFSDLELIGKEFGGLLQNLSINCGHPI